MLTYLLLFCSLARNIFRSRQDVLLENLALLTLTRFTGLLAS